ncbi:MAG: hypothetical protein RLZZ380_69 [Actinomycetota bacterium]|jgi:hypothetical protein
MIAKRSLRAFAVAAALSLVGVNIGFVSSAQAATCEVTRPLTRATVQTDALELGGTLTRYSFGAGQGNSSPYESRFTVAKANLNYTTLEPTTAPYLRDRSQISLAQGVNALVHVNGDFFDFSSRMPYSAIGRGSQLSYAPQGRSKVLGLRTVAASSKTGILANARVKSGSKTFTISGLNLSVLTGSRVIAYNSAYSSSILPAATSSILVVNGKITKVYSSGTRTRPKSGYVFSAVGSMAASLRALKVGATFAYKAPAGRIVALSRDYVTSSGTISNSVGKALATISGVNLWSSNYATGMVLFDDKYDATPPRGAGTVVIGSNSVVTKVYSSGSSQSIPSGGLVLQFYGSVASKVSGFSVGSKVNVNRSFTASSGSSYNNVFGIGATLISNGTLVAPCTGNSDTVRPRTAVGWDDKGNVYLATTTMGRDWADGGQGGYRVGGSTVHQMADWLKDVGATNAVSLDGGGSTTMFAKLAGNYRRVDLPDGVWVRWIPTGVALTSR